MTPPTNNSECKHEHTIFFRAQRNTGRGIFAYRLFTCEDCNLTWWVEVK